MSGHADTIKRVANDWIGFKPEAEHRERLLKAVFDATDAQVAENQRLREAGKRLHDLRDQAESCRDPAEAPMKSEWDDAWFALSLALAGEDG